MDIVECPAIWCPLDPWTPVLQGKNRCPLQITLLSTPLGERVRTPLPLRGRVVQSRMIRTMKKSAARLDVLRSRVKLLNMKNILDTERYDLDDHITGLDLVSTMGVLDLADLWRARARLRARWIMGSAIDALPDASLDRFAIALDVTTIH